MLTKFAQLSSLGNFANGRDVQTIPKGIIGAIMKAKAPATSHGLTITEDFITSQIDKMIAERTARAQSALSVGPPDASGGALRMDTKVQDRPAPPRATAKLDVASVEQQSIVSEEQSAPQDDEGADEPDDGPCHKSSFAIRDVGVSDEVWQQLQRDKQKAEEEQRERQWLAEEEVRLQEWLKKCADAKLQHELAEIERKRQELEAKLRREAEEQAKLAKMGVCPMEYQWIRQEGGYRCAGGSHRVSDAQMKKLCGA